MTEEEFWKILQDVPEPTPIFYRLYYSDNSAPIIYSMEHLPGNYIDVDQKTFVLAPFNVRVVDGRLTYIKPTITVKKLQPTQVNGTACNPQDVCIVVGQDQLHTKWNLVNNELN
jgi:hypothetical protein